MLDAEFVTPLHVVALGRVGSGQRNREADKHGGAGHTGRKISNSLFRETARELDEWQGADCCSGLEDGTATELASRGLRHCFALDGSTYWISIPRVAPGRRPYSRFCGPPARRTQGADECIDAGARQNGPLSDGSSPSSAASLAYARRDLSEINRPPGTRANSRRRTPK